MTQTINYQNQTIPTLGLGTWQALDGECADAVEYALSIGYRHIDTAQIYENEAEVGQGMARSSVSRGDIFLTTKIWMDQLAEGDLQASLDESLKKLGTDYVDLLLIHWPVEEVPLAEQLGALESVKQAGKVRLTGVSNYTVQWLENAKAIAPGIVNNQVEYHPFLSQAPVLEWLRKHDMFLTAYCPLARGQIKSDTTLKEIGAAHGKTPGQVALRWLVQQEAVVAIPKSVNKSRIKENVEIFDFALSDDEMQQISALTNQQKRLIAPGWSPDWDAAIAA